MFFSQTNLYISNVTQQCRCSPVLIYRAWATCAVANVDNHLVVASHAVPKNVCVRGYLVVDYDSNVADN